MADIYTKMTPVLDGISAVYTHLKNNSFTASKTDLEFTVAFKNTRKFLGLSEGQTALFCCIFSCYMGNGEKPVCIGELSQATDTNALRFLEFRADFDALEEKGFITSGKNEERGSRARCYSIPDEVTEAVLKGDASLIAKGLRTKDYDLMYPEDIAEKELFYAETIREDIRSLFSYFEQEQFGAIQDRLAAKGMGRGVCVMLHGDSGTGKTETVYQLARRTGRAVYHVDIGALESQWIGATEQNLSELFRKYKRICARAHARGENVPIMLFNEADALFGKRVEQVRHSADIYYNHINSILLDCMEKQQGILIATTNLPGALDTAFERRFLFKIKFEKPDLEMKKKIWQSKAGWLEDRTVAHLAESYALSGGEIDNVVRKAEMHEILTGIRSSVTEIEDFCRKEKLEGSRRNRIGFGG
ncbi:MAG: ATP-binding protein [Treponema sp.]|nr:ATP-binding protein [Treponema sp.]